MFILYTFEVSKLDRSIDFNFEQYLNIQSIRVTFDVLKLERLIDSNEEQP